MEVEAIKFYLEFFQNWSTNPLATKHLELLSKSLQFAFSRGMLVWDFNRKTKHKSYNVDGSITLFKAAPCKFTLFPTIFPKNEYDVACRTTLLYLNIVDILTCNPSQIERALKTVALSDNFTAKLLEIQHKVYLNPHGRSISDDIRLHLVRSDYMLNQASNLDEVAIKQVEFNTISVSCMAYAQSVSKLHLHHLNQLLMEDNIKFSKMLESITKDCYNKPALDFVNAILSCNELYRDRHNINQTPTSILQVMRNGEAGGFDQNYITQKLRDSQPAKLGLLQVLSLTIDELIQLQKNGDIWISHDKKLLSQINTSTIAPALQMQHNYDDNKNTYSIMHTGPLILLHQTPLNKKVQLEISVVYYRSMYSPDDFPSSSEWILRELFEWSDAVKIPSIPAHLSGCKKIQQLLTSMDFYMQILSEEKLQNLKLKFDELFPVFANQYDPSSPNSIKICTSALENPEEFVLKPQREGGGNCLFGEDLKQVIQQYFIQQQKTDKAASINDYMSQYVLMQKIKPPLARSLFIDQNIVESDCRYTASTKSSISELGIYACSLYSGKNLCFQRNSGHVLRTKTIDTDEGGVTCGYASVDSPYLIHSKQAHTLCFQNLT